MKSLTYYNQQTFLQKGDVIRVDPKNRISIRRNSIPVLIEGEEDFQFTEHEIPGFSVRIVDLFRIIGGIFLNPRHVSSLWTEYEVQDVQK